MNQQHPGTRIIQDIGDFPLVDQQIERHNYPAGLEYANVKQGKLRAVGKIQTYPIPRYHPVSPQGVSQTIGQFTELPMGYNTRVAEDGGSCGIFQGTATNQLNQLGHGRWVEDGDSKRTDLVLLTKTRSSGYGRMTLIQLITLWPRPFMQLMKARL